MPSKTLPAHLRQVLQAHVDQSQLSDDDELREIMTKLSTLNERVEALKASARAKKADRIAQCSPLSNERS
ncbi:hypothetical protein OE749_12915 [Aestuariibacter sp. AA17]|uniref:Uncharacterized protein n=1 Tax=Fluctibacter corallii TaxID=2984329 RepID=A0ABT3AAF0_9ALTE|nr:hypothetical protein [Aestuariibacter sp. AA17]MCV2885594.1 hypothetical protein [Aestuariibacter sp. AA17]